MNLCNLESQADLFMLLFQDERNNVQNNDQASPKIDSLCELKKKPLQTSNAQLYKRCRGV